MSPTEKWFFWSYLFLQILIPLKHFICVHLKGRDGRLTHSDRAMFAWTMKFIQGQRKLEFHASDRRNGRSLMPRRDIQLRTIQRQILHFGPDEAIQMAQAIAERIHQESGIPKEDIAVYCRCRVNINGRGFRERIRPDVDLTREKRHLFWGYSWYHP